MPKSASSSAALAPSARIVRFAAMRSRRSVTVSRTPFFATNDLRFGAPDAAAAWVAAGAVSSS